MKAFGETRLGKAQAAGRKSNPGVRVETAWRNTDGHKAVETLRTGLEATWAANGKVTGRGLSMPVTRDGCLN